ncbi:unnamed protein product [Polarella glacialis]|uniref:Uncharacterized protein n=1 Tax=Polarella glacialis TaxID=89957 RepID=A0A813LSX0_POLGL|nr:unnamed protein product [Polarella glacialis]
MSVKMRDAEGATLMQKATHSGKTTILKLLVDKGGNLNAKGSYGYAPLHEACYIGHPDVCNYLFQMKANVDALSKNGSTPLLVAAREGHTIVCEALLRYTADADDGGDKGWTPLSVSAREGPLEVCQTLLKYNASVHGLSGDGRYERSALQEASEQGHADVVSLLVDLQVLKTAQKKIKLFSKTIINKTKSKKVRPKPTKLSTRLTSITPSTRGNAE